MSIDHWLTWHPTDEIIVELQEQEPPKPEPAPFDPLDDLRPLFVAWFNAKIWLDAIAVATRNPLTWMTGVNALHRDCCAWMSAHDPVVPPSRDEFLAMLRELGCTIRLVGAEEFVANVALKADREAQLRFDEADSEPAKPAAPTMPAKQPPTPASYRIVRQEPVRPPIQVSESETVVDVEKFVASTLRELDRRLRGNLWLAGNWSVETLLVRLRAVGCEVEIVDDNQTIL